MNPHNYRHSYTRPYVTTNRIQEPVELENQTPVTHSENFKIVVILDESGSMDSIRNDMIGSLNTFITQQKEVKARPCNFTLVKFNNNVERIICNTDLREVRCLKSKDFRPSGMTALYDAIGDTINWFRYESDVLMVIITDGQENCSKSFKKSNITKMLEEKQKFKNWSYVYLGCDLATAAQGDAMGLQSSRTASNCSVAQRGYGDFISNTLCNAVTQNRSTGVSVQSQLNKI
jgi:Mg-chelatase subunit ChlD